MTDRQAPETWEISKPAVEAAGGLVASQHFAASEAGAAMLRAGGNAVDAAVAASLMIGTVEPWMSGLGGGGVMLVYRAKEDRVDAIDFGMVAPKRLDPADYPLTGGRAADLFGWPGVQDDRNLQGYHSICVPGYVDGLATALEQFGTKDWRDCLAPARESAERGMPVDWYATLKIVTAAKTLARYEASREAYLPGGHTPVGEWGGPLPRIKLGKLAETLKRLDEAGPRDLYEGELAGKMVADLNEGGNRMAADDLSEFHARVMPADEGGYRDADVHTAPGLTAGPSLMHALGALAGKLNPGEAPDEAAYAAYVESLQESYEHRFATMGDADESRDPSCTTHLTVVDREGNIVALTQTLLSLFGSKVMLPQTGMTMNNGIMWFDPRPGGPNAIRPGRRPLSNMCPTIVRRRDGLRFGIGASGGRRIYPAVFQLISFLVDYAMDMGAAFHQPRIDYNGGDHVGVDAKLAPAARKALGERFATEDVVHGVYPALFACPNAAGRRNGSSTGACFVMSPWAKVVAE